MPREIKYLAIGLGLATLASVAQTVMPEPPKYSLNDLIYTENTSRTTERGMLKAGMTQYFDVDKKDNLTWDVGAYVIICDVATENRREYLVEVYDRKNNRLFIYKISGELERIVEGDEDLNAILPAPQREPECPIISSA